MMNQLSITLGSFRRISGLGLLATGIALSAAGCGAADVTTSETEDLSADDVGTVDQALTTWTDVSLQAGWSKFGSVKPGVANIGGVITFRGGLKATANAGSMAFTIPSSFWPVSGSNSSPIQVDTRVTMSGNKGGMLHFIYNGTTVQASVKQDGPVELGTEARTMTSLNGVSYDRTSTGSTTLTPAAGWKGIYGFRTNQADILTPTVVKTSSGYVRFQGKLEEDGAHGADPTLLFTLPSSGGYRPGQSVEIPVALGTSDSGSEILSGRLMINSNGQVTFSGANGQNTAGYGGLSLEGASYSMTLDGTVALNLVNSWAATSARAVKVRNDNGVIRFQGAIANGTAAKIATLDSGMRPPTETIYVLAESVFGTQSQLIIGTNGDITVHSSALSGAKLFLSLDSVSFAL